MFFSSLLKIPTCYLLFLFIFSSLLIACGGGGGGNTTSSNNQTAKEIALEKIMTYAEDGSKPTPTLQDYVDAGVTGVSNATLAELNILVDALGANDVDTTEELELLTIQLGTNTNIAPISDAGEDKIIQVNQSITLTGSGSDSDGSIVSYVWKRGTSILASTSSFIYTPSTVGTDVLTLTVIDDDGGTAIDSMNVTVTAVPEQVDIKQFFNYGQSLSVGAKATPILSSSQPYNNIMFNGGLRAGKNNAGLISFIPLIEGNKVESQASETANNIIKRLINEDGIQFTDQASVYLASTPGAGKTKISDLSKGSDLYTTLLTQTKAAKEIAQGIGKSHHVSFITFLQGESNYSPPTPEKDYAASLVKLISDLNNDISAITEQSFIFPMITYQLASHRLRLRKVPTVALGYLLASRTDSNIQLSVPMYIFDYVDNLHTDNESNRQIGNYFARTYKRVAIDKTGWTPLQPNSVKWQGEVIDIKFDVPVKPLVFDTNWVAAETNQGFDIWNSDFSAVLDIIKSVSIVGQDTVRIVMSTEPPNGSHVTYAFGRDKHNGFSGRTSGPRGNLRDSAGDSDFYTDNSGVLRRMDNYGVIFSEQK